MIPEDWTPHRRDDGELLGWIRPEGDDWLAVDVLGREVPPPQEWLEAEAALEERGLAWLTDPWILEGESEDPLRVRILEVVPGGEGRILVKADDLGAVGGPPTPRYELLWPLPPQLRPPGPSDPDGRTI